MNISKRRINIIAASLFCGFVSVFTGMKIHKMQGVKSSVKEKPKIQPDSLFYKKVQLLHFKIDSRSRYYNLLLKHSDGTVENILTRECRVKCRGTLPPYAFIPYAKYNKYPSVKPVYYAFDYNPTDIERKKIMVYLPEEYKIEMVCAD